MLSARSIQKVLLLCVVFLVGVSVCNAQNDKAKVARPEFEWQQGIRQGNLFIRDEKRELPLKIVNRSDEPLEPMTINVILHDQYEDRDLEPIEIKLNELIPPQAEKVVKVDLNITKAGVYKVTVVGPDKSTATTQVGWIRGEQPEDYQTELPFFGNSSHSGITEYEYKLRREFGSRAERASQIEWHHKQKQPSVFLWGDINEDPIKTIARKTGSLIFGYTGYTPSFASSEPGDKKNMHDVPVLKYYIEWLEAAAKHYEGVVDYWEIWNEPDSNGTFFRGTAEQLADLHKAGALAIKRINPELKTIGASTVQVDTAYMDRLYDAGAVDYMDVIAFHLYRWNYPPDASIVSELKRMNDWRDKYAPGRPLWDNEWGPFVDQRKNPTRYADIVSRHLVLNKAMGNQHSDCYTWKGHWYRLWFDGHIPTPAAIAYRTTAQQLTNALPVAEVSGGKDGVFAYIFANTFKEPVKYTLAAWVTGETQAESLNIPVLPKRVNLTDLMGNPLKYQIEKGKVDLEITKSPVFLEGVRPNYVKNLKKLSRPANGNPPVRHPSLWYSYHYPKGTDVFSLPYGSTKTLQLRMYNDGDKEVSGKLHISCKGNPLKVSTNNIKIDVPAKSFKDIDFKVTAPLNLEEGVYYVNIKGIADNMSCGNMRIRCYVSEYEVTQFHMATWELVQHLVDAKNYGQGVHVRWINPEGYLKFKFDLTGAASAKLAGYVDSFAPTTDGGNFRFSASLDGEKWDVLLEGRGKWAWREVDLTPYVGNEVFLRFDNPTAKGQARIRQIRLKTISRK